MKKNAIGFFKHLLFALLWCGISSSGFGQTKIASIFNHHMVLQQNTHVAIWGTDKPNTKITISANWNEKQTTVSDKNGHWKLHIKTGKAGGPFTLKIMGSTNVTLNDILLGEVWLCSGQSNMEMPMNGFAGQPITGSNDILLNSDNDEIRLFNVKRNMSTNPLDTCGGTWHVSNAETVENFSAVAYLYGKMLQEKLKVPVGIICSSVGGTRVEAWTKKEVLEQLKFEYKKKQNPNQKIDKNDPSALFNAMIQPLIPFTIKGVLWYQGESNISNASQYKERFSAMINSWRKDWSIGDLPFYFTQIAPFEYSKEFNAAYLREAQLQTMQQTVHTGMAITMDIGEKDCIHPAQKKQVAERLAYWALAKTYGFSGFLYSGPIYKSMSVTDNKVQLEFDYAPNGLTSFGKSLSQFTIAGADRKFHPAKAEIIKGKLTVYSENVSNPVAVRYGWENYTEGTLFNLGGLPASSFRTDNW